MTHAPPPASALERYLAFAFAGADLLVEVDAQDRIVFAEGAFQARFGVGGAQFLGRALGNLVADDQQDQLAGAMALLRGRGRLHPTPLRLADRGRSAAMLAGLIRPGRGAALTFGPVPEAIAAEHEAAAGGTRAAPGDMLRAMEARARASQGGALTMVEIAGCRADPDSVAQAVLGALAALAPGALADRLEQGRFGVLTDQAVPTEATRRQVEATLAAHGIDPGQVRVADLDLQPERLTPGQAVRAIRFALGRFAASGTEGLERLGAADDLSGLIAGATARASALRGAIAARRFALMYQPIVSLADQQPHHHEALFRPDAGEADSPAEFVAMAEAVGLSQELDLAVALVASDTVERVAGCSVAVNVSGASMESPDFLERLLQICRRAKALRGRLLFELTETAEIGRPDMVQKALATLREAGHPVCLDDLGAGNAGFGYLQRFAVDYVKVDGAYVRNAQTSSRDAAILTSIVALSKSLNSAVVAEQVETEAQLRMLAGMGVEYGQGFLFGRPARQPTRP